MALDQISPLYQLQAVLEARLAAIPDEADVDRAADEYAAAELLQSCVDADIDRAGSRQCLLRHLYVGALKQVREVDLWFPGQGAVLVEGRNEAGKSTLLEAIYFALYGVPWNTPAACQTLDDLLPRDGGPAYVELSLAVNDAYLEIRRQLLPPSREAAQEITHEATLLIRGSHAPLGEFEEIHGAPEVNSRLLDEIDDLDGDTLRLCCFLQRNGLDQLERLGPEQVESLLTKFPVAKQLKRIGSELWLAAESIKEQADQLEKEYEIAVLRENATAAEQQAARAEEQTHAARVRLLLDERDSRDVARELQEEKLAALGAREYRLRARMMSSTRLTELQNELDTLAHHLNSEVEDAEVVAAAQLVLADLEEQCRLEGISYGEPTLFGEQVGPAAVWSKLRAQHEELERAVDERRADLGTTDEHEAVSELANLSNQIRTLQRQEEEEAALSARVGEQVVELLARYTPIGRVYYGSEPLDKLASDWPLLANVDVARLDSYEGLCRSTSQEAHRLRLHADTQAQTYGLASIDLDTESSHQRLLEVVRRRRRYELASQMAEQVRSRVMQFALPQVEHYMGELLPELTAGRYRNTELIVNIQHGQGTGFSIRLWDEENDRHVAHHTLSSGTREQCSLALCLAFAFTAFSSALGSVPGFIILDDPVDSFDAERTRALAQILTEGAVAQHFAQVVLSSHSEAVHRQSFRFYVDLENGRTRESNLPSADTAH